MTAGFLMAVIALIVGIVIAVPEYAKPAAGAGVVASPSADPSAGPEGHAANLTPLDAPTSVPPNKLRKYRWPVRGGDVHTWFEYRPDGRFEIDNQRVHDGILITWFKGALVKAAHRGRVVAAGRDWIQHVGYDGPLDEIERKIERKKGPWADFPRGVVIDDGNGYYSVYTELQDLKVKPDDKVKAGTIIGSMSAAESKLMMRYRLIRMDGLQMKVHQSDRQLGYPDYARERVDPMVVLDLEAPRMPRVKRPPPDDPPRLSDY
jgi:hypothetical protein